MRISKTNATIKEREEVRKHQGAPLVLGRVGGLAWSIFWEHGISSPRESSRARTRLWKCHCRGKEEPGLTNCTGENGNMGQRQEQLTAFQSQLPSLLPLQMSLGAHLSAHKPSVPQRSAFLLLP